MRVSTISSLVFPALATSNAVLPQPAGLTSAASTPTPTIALAALIAPPTTATIKAEYPILTAAPGQDNLDLRAIIVDPHAPAHPKAPDAPIVDPNAPVPPKAPGAPIVDPNAPPKAPDALVTTQWLETKINGIKTWVPVTITMAFAAVPQQASMPGKGEIGLGTLTGAVGVTKTLNIAVETGKAVWKRGAFAAAGAAAIGLAF